MTDQQEALRAAQRAVKKAKMLEDGGMAEQARECYEYAEVLYEEAGVDADWFDDAVLVGELDEPEPPMKTLWLFPTTAVELTYDPDEDEPAGIVVDIEDLDGIDP